jgi:septal ring-binding cell division protein DamX
MAVHWWEKAAEQGLAEAQYNLALAYQEGAGVPRDEQMAARYYRQAAENGHSDASAAIAETDRPARSSNETDCEHWLSEQSPNAYTLQLMSTTRPEDIQELAREHDLSGYVVCSYTHEGDTRYALLIGAYPDIDTASAAAAGLPRGLKTGKPWVRKIKDLMRIAAGTAH